MLRNAYLNRLRQNEGKKGKNSVDEVQSCSGRRKKTCSYRECFYSPPATPAPPCSTCTEDVLQQPSKAHRSTRYFPKNRIRGECTFTPSHPARLDLVVSSRSQKLKPLEEDRNKCQTIIDGERNIESTSSKNEAATPCEKVSSSSTADTQFTKSEKNRVETVSPFSVSKPNEVFPRISDGTKKQLDEQGSQAQADPLSYPQSDLNEDVELVECILESNNDLAKDGTQALLVNSFSEHQGALKKSVDESKEMVKTICVSEGSYLSLEGYSTSCEQLDARKKGVLSRLEALAAEVLGESPVKIEEDHSPKLKKKLIRGKEMIFDFQSHLPYQGTILETGRSKSVQFLSLQVPETPETVSIECQNRPVSEKCDWVISRSTNSDENGKSDDKLASVLVQEYESSSSVQLYHSQLFLFLPNPKEYVEEANFRNSLSLF